jgi:S-adenosylmethionine:tRNA ribosyltransferase-isomerase
MSDFLYESSFVASSSGHSPSVPPLATLTDTSHASHLVSLSADLPAISTFAFELPESLNASAPPERRGMRRDHVRLMALDRRTGETAHGRFFDLERYLRQGDLLVLNTSRTMPAVLYGTRHQAGAAGPTGGGADQVEVRLAGRQVDGTWKAIILGARIGVGETISFSKQLTARIVTAPSVENFTPSAISTPNDNSNDTSEDISSLATVRFSCDGTELEQRIYEIGQPVRYEYISEPWDLDYYQTVFATVAGSLEMPSAGRPFSWELLFRLQRRGIGIADLQLHTGLSYWPGQKRQQHPSENGESFRIPAATIEAVQRTRNAGGRVIAVGTTVVRALESAFVDDSAAQLNRNLQSHVSGWTYLYIDRYHSLRVVDGLITGFHEPEASHLALLSAFIDPALLRKAYQEAIHSSYLWHEFGDVNLIL